MAPAVSADTTPAGSGTIELLAGHETATLDLKLAVDFNDRLKFFTRHRVTSDYEGNIPGTFHAAKLGYRLIDGLSPIAGVMGTSNRWIAPQVGLEYGHKFGDFGLYQLAWISTESDWEINTLTNLTYTPKLSDNVGLFLGLEGVSYFNSEGHKISFQRPRAGLNYKGLILAAAADFTEKGNDGKFGYNLGGIAKVVFK